MSFDWSIYKGNLKWLPESTIYITRHGSHAYGTDLPTSDLDLRGIAIAPPAYYFGFLNHFEQAAQAEPDLTIFELRKFFGLAAECNPNALELLFTDPSDHLLVTPAVEPLLSNRDLFLSRKAKHTFSGYAISQLKRINIHYRWLKNPPTKEPTRAEFGLPERVAIPRDQLVAAEAVIKKKMDEWNWHELDAVDPAIRQALKDDFQRMLAEVTQWGNVEDKTYTAAARAAGISDNVLEILQLEKQYNAKLKEWQNYNEWKAKRNPKRAELEEKFGYDTKHAMHLVRLLRMCREILEGKGVIVRRPDAQELLEIRAGTWTYEDLITWATQQDKELTEAMKTSPLPEQVDRVALDQLCASIVVAF